MMRGMGRWRTGRKVGRTIYYQEGEEPSDQDNLIGVMDTPWQARAAVDAVNGRAPEEDSRPDPVIEIRPGVNFGRPLVGRAGASVEAIIERIWAGEGVADVAEDHGATRADALVACWFVAAYGVSDVAAQMDGTFKRWGKKWAKRWEKWANENTDVLWHHDYDKVTDPPSRTD